MVRFRTSLQSEFARYVFANSITLTPGTVTLSVDGDKFVVHAISKKVADELPGEMEKRVAKIFDQG
jgi:multicomponent Na+:H+ antiporter subunit E